VPEGKEQIARRQRLVDRVQLERHLPEPHHVRPQRPPAFARRTSVRHREIAPPWTDRGAGRAARLQQLAVHVDQVLRASALMQVVDVLSDDLHGSGPTALQLGQRPMRRVGRDVPTQQLATAQIVEPLHHVRLPRERLGGRNLVQPPAHP
jgi:hypothetical protein